MAERIMRWSIRLDADDREHYIGWGEIAYIEIADMPATVMNVYTIELIEDGEFIDPDRPVRLVKPGHDLPEDNEVLGGATYLGTDMWPKHDVYFLVAVGEGVGPVPGGGYHSLSIVLPEGIISVSITPNPEVEGDHDFDRIVHGGIEHMRFLMATGVHD